MRGGYCVCWIREFDNDPCHAWKRFPHYWPFVKGIYPSPGMVSTHKRRVKRRFNTVFVKKQSSYRWFEMPWRLMWYHCNASAQCRWECNYIDIPGIRRKYPYTLKLYTLLRYQIRALDMKTMLFYGPCQLIYRIFDVDFHLHMHFDLSFVWICGICGAILNSELFSIKYDWVQTIIFIMSGKNATFLEILCQNTLFLNEKFVFRFIFDRMLFLVVWYTINQNWSWW